MELVKNSVLALLLVLFAVVYADPVANVSSISEPEKSVKPLDNEKDIETTAYPNPNPTRVPSASSEAPALVHASSPAAVGVAVEEKTTIAAATMQGAPEKSDGGSTKTENEKGSATTHYAVYPFLISTTAVVLFSSFLRV